MKRAKVLHLSGLDRKDTDSGIFLRERVLPLAPYSEV
jgi:hypothetical protein